MMLMVINSRSGIAPVIILIALAVVSSAVVAVVLTHPEIVQKISSPSPNTILDVKLLKNNSRYELVFECLGGDELDLKDVEVAVLCKGAVEKHRYPFLYDRDGILKVDEKFGVALNLSLSPGDLLKVKVIHIPTSFVILEKEIVVGEGVAPTTTTTPTIPVTTATPTPTPTLPTPPNSSYLVLNVNKLKWYKTIGDAVKDADDGNTILVYPGYDVRQNLNIDKALEIKAVEAGNATIRGEIRLKSEGVKINGFKIYGFIRIYKNNSYVLNNEIISTTHYGIWIYKAGDIEIYGNTIYKPYYGIYIYYGNGIVEIRSNNITAKRYGIRLYHGDTFIISDNNIVDGYYGIYASHIKKGMVKSNTIENVRSGVLHYASNSVVVVDNVIKCRYVAVYATKAEEVQVKRNYIEGSTGVYLNRCNDCKADIEENNIVWKDKSRGRGVYLYRCSNIALTIEKNKLANYRQGIFIYKCSGLTDISSNNVSNARYGILVEYASNTRIASNELNDVYYGIGAYCGSNYTVEENIVKRRVYYGIFLYKASYSTVKSNSINCTESISPYGLSIKRSNYIDISDNTIIGTDSLSGRGILLRDNNNVRVIDNKVEKFRMGIYGYKCTDTTIESNEIENCKRYYIYLYGFRNTSITNNNLVTIPRSNVQCINLYSCSDMTISKNSIIGDYNELGIYTANGKRINITDNKISGFRYYAIYAYRGSEVVISSNKIESCREGIKLYRTSKSTITQNTVNNSRYGIKLSRSNDNIVHSNTVTNCTKVGLVLDYYSYQNSIYDNTIKNNEWGICIYSSDRNTIHSNVIENNKNGGIYLWRSDQNTIYNNLFNNTYNVKVYKGANTWNTTKTAGTNIIGGNYIGGNAWLKPDGSGFSQTCTDEDGDGICDSAYVINTQNVDYLPLKAK